MYEEIALERLIKDKFSIDADIAQAIVFKIPVGLSAEATLYLTSKKQLYLFISSQTKILFSDVRKIVSKMGLRADTYLPPKGDVEYFNIVAKAKFKEIFPGRTNISEQDLIYYKTLAVYNPALVQISEVLKGQIYQFDSDASGNWRPSKKFSYRRLKTS